MGCTDDGPYNYCRCGTPVAIWPAVCEDCAEEDAKPPAPASEYPGVQPREPWPDPPAPAQPAAARLPPCPVCGDYPEEFPDAALVACEACGVEVHGHDPAMAAATWRRLTQAAISPAREEVERLQGELFQARRLRSLDAQAAGSELYGANERARAAEAALAAAEERATAAEAQIARLWDEDAAGVLDALHELTPHLSGTPLERIAVIRARLAAAERAAELNVRQLEAAVADLDFVLRLCGEDYDDQPEHFIHHCVKVDIPATIEKTRARLAGEKGEAHGE